MYWKKGKDPHPQDEIQHLDFTKDPRPLYYKTPPCAFYHKNVVKPFSVLSKEELALSKTGRFLSKAEILGVGVFSPLSIVREIVCANCAFMWVGRSFGWAVSVVIVGSLLLCAT